MTRRTLLSGCAAIFAAVGVGVADQADAAGHRRAPRASCPHIYCRNHRPDPDGVGICGLSLCGPVVGPIEEVP